MAPTIGTKRVQLDVHSRAHVEQLGREARRLSLELGFPEADAERVVLATIELATNLVRYAPNGHVVLQQLMSQDRVGMQIESHDDGPGIANIESAMTDGFSTGNGFGDGLPAVKRLLHEFTIDSGGSGTHIVGRRWIGAS